MLNVEGRKVKDVDSAIEFMRRFISESFRTKDEPYHGKTYDFDLFLPMMMDRILNVPAPDDTEYQTTDELESVYMEAAWEMVVRGILRPGPRTTNGESGGDFYGKGYSFTLKGKKWFDDGSTNEGPESEMVEWPKKAADPISKEPVKANPEGMSSAP